MSMTAKAAVSRRASPLIVAYAALALYAGALGYLLQPVMLIDDAAISFRYAERLAAGKGFTYNDHEHVLGASNPLYTLILAGFAKSGVDLETAARALGVALFAASVVLAAIIAAGLSDRWGGWVAGFLLASLPFFRDLELCGMESGLSVFLGLSVVLALMIDRPALAGVFLGLAVWNKLDAGMLALGVAAAWLSGRRTPPFKIIAVSALVALPWFAFSVWYFGSPFPHSMVVKMASGSPQADHIWVIRELSRLDNGFIFLLAPAVAMFLPRVWRAMDPRQRVAAGTLGGWFVFHSAAFSIVWLGDYYHWYLTVLVPPLVILASAGGCRLVDSARLRRRNLVLTAAGVAALLVAAGFKPLDATIAQLHGGSLVGSQVFDFDRRMAGLFLGQYAGPSEVVASRFGWVAYGVPSNPFNDHTGLNSKRLSVPETYWVMHGISPYAGFSRPGRPRGFEPLATFNLLSDLAPGTSWFVVFGRPDSTVARSGKRFVELRLFELPAPQPYSADYGLSGVAIAGNDLRSNPPDGATFAVQNDHQPVRVIFTPVVVGPALAGETSHTVTFELRMEDKPLNEWHLAAGQGETITAVLPGAEALDRLAVSFITKTDPDTAQAYEGVWRGVKVVIGDAYPDLAVLGNNPLVGEWMRRNGVAPSRR
jgi:hypothetical protein